MNDLTAADVIEAWDDAATRDDFAAAIHPTGHDPAAYAESGRCAADEVLMMLDAYGDGDISSVVEFGVGNGRVARWLCDEPGLDVYGYDASDEMLAHLGVDAPCVIGAQWNGLDVPNLTPDPAVFDVAYSFAVFIHLTPTDGAKVLANLARIVRPGGLIMLDVPLYEQMRTRAGWSDVTVWTEGFFRSAADDAGLDVVEYAVDPGAFAFDDVGVNHSRLKVLRRPL